MEDLATIKAKFATLQTETLACLVRVAEDFQHIKEQIADGVVVKQADLDAMGAGLDSAIASLRGTDPDPSFPSAAPTAAR